MLAGPEDYLNKIEASLEKAQSDKTQEHKRTPRIYPQVRTRNTTHCRRPGVTNYLANTSMLLLKKRSLKAFTVTSLSAKVNRVVNYRSPVDKVQTKAKELQRHVVGRLDIFFTTKVVHEHLSAGKRGYIRLQVLQDFGHIKKSSVRACHRT
ncbi:hypothetical protein BDN67DRAFT_63732 [Paxillus ammoniavirescens]|nr:hypothetical protein BDN67DRAFT_63732 [Paxillus ammoniavirescens]